jgi:hypothetical protein
VENRNKLDRIAMESRFFGPFHGGEMHQVPSDRRFAAVTVAKGL